jgi:hypothetical protein
MGVHIFAKYNLQGISHAVQTHCKSANYPRLFVNLRGFYLIFSLQKKALQNELCKKLRWCPAQGICKA